MLSVYLFHHTVLSVYWFGPQGLPRLQTKVKLRNLCAEGARFGHYLTIEGIQELYDADRFKDRFQEKGIERQDLTEEACLLAVRCRSCAKQSRAHAHNTYSKAGWRCSVGSAPHQAHVS